MKSRLIAIVIHKRVIYGRLQLSQFVFFFNEIQIRKQAAAWVSVVGPR